MNERERDDEARVRELLETAGPRPEVPDADLEAIVAAARAEWRTHWAGAGERPGSRTAGRRWWPAAAALAATLAVALGLGWWWRQGARSAGPPPVVARVEGVTGSVEVVGSSGAAALAADAVLRAGSELRSDGTMAGPRARAALRLATGTVVRVDGGSRLRLVSDRILELDRGAIYLDTGAAGGAVEVRTPLGTARDVGTRFTVRLAGGGPGGGAGSLRVQVRDGAVEVARGRSTIRATRGDELLLHGDGTVERREVPVHGPAWEWVIDAGPELELDGRTLAELLDRVSAETGWRILYEDAALAAAAEEIVVHGSLGGLRADRAPFVVLPGAGLEGELRGGVLVVRRGSG